MAANTGRIAGTGTGNDYRIAPAVVRIDYAHGVVFIRFVGTHARYNRINALEV